jgi:hypothetical protein
VSTIPNFERAVIEAHKLTDYLLSQEHPLGRSKANFFQRLGFTRDQPNVLEAGLRRLLSTPNEVAMEDTGFGMKYIVDGTLAGPSGVAAVRTVWIVETGSDLPRFVTAYPRSHS